MENARFSIIIPARNEEPFIGGCLESIDRAARRVAVPPEIVVVLNRCTDRTEDVVRGRAKIVREDASNLARIRNAGAAAAMGEILVTIDADSRMSENMLEEIDRAMRSGRTIGGGVPVKAERLSLGILTTGFLLAIPFMVRRLSAGLFWVARRDYEAMGGFDEHYVMAEDYHFARRLKEFGRKRGLKFGTLWRTHIVTSCRKFDRLGDWFVWRMILRRPGFLVEAFRGRNTDMADRYWYEFQHSEADRLHRKKMGAE